MTRFSFASSGRTDTGCVRDHNEDAFFEKPEIGLWVVADGMGGHTAGDVASGMVVDVLSSITPADKLAEFATVIERRVLDVNGALREMSTRRHAQAIGCTLVALVVREQLDLCIWAGDSRIYQHRDGELTQVTQDHALVEEMVSRGMLSRAEAENHPQSNLITRAVGATDDLFLDFEVVEIQAGDQFLLCSDGLTGEVDDSAISLVMGDDNVADKSNVLVDMALSHGGKDNTTAVVVKVNNKQSS